MPESICVPLCPEPAPPSLKTGTSVKVCGRAGGVGPENFTPWEWVLPA